MTIGKFVNFDKINEALDKFNAEDEIILKELGWSGSDVKKYLKDMERDMDADEFKNEMTRTVDEFCENEIQVVSDDSESTHKAVYAFARLPLLLPGVDKKYPKTWKALKSLIKAEGYTFWN